MESLDMTTLGTLCAVVAFMYTYFKDRFDSGKALGQLEERVSRLEHRDKTIEQMSESLTNLRVHIAKIEQELSTVTEWIRSQKS